MIFFLVCVCVCARGGGRARVGEFKKKNPNLKKNLGETTTVQYYFETHA